MPVSSGTLNKAQVSQMDPSCTILDPSTPGAECFSPEDAIITTCMVRTTGALLQLVLIVIINFIYTAPVPVLHKRAPSTVQFYISGSMHS